MMDLPATQNTVEVNGNVIIQFDDDENITKEHNYSDSLSMLGQLGLFG
jgi:hypothetical protein